MIDIERLVRETVKESLKTAPREPITPKKRISCISLRDAKLLAEKVEEQAQIMGVKAVVAISDEGGNLKLLECMDDSFIASRDIAANKAFTAVSLKTSTAKLATLAQPGGPLFGIQNTNGGRIVIFGGGDTLESGGRILGGIGVSGGTAEEDTALSLFGKRVFSDLFAYNG